MPLTPFIGLSVLVNLLVIWSYWIVSFVGSLFGFESGKPGKLTKHSTMTVPKRVTVASRGASLAIIAAIFLFVIANATFLLEKSVEDKDSSVHLAGDFISYYYRQTMLASIVSSPVATCVPSQDHVPASFGNSVVNYMAAEGLDYSFQNRQIVATNIGIEDYEGTAPQNEALLVALMSQNGNSSQDQETAQNGVENLPGTCKN